jgi:glycosyltransferase involved in cell wall biosynthesis
MPMIHTQIPEQQHIVSIGLFVFNGESCIRDAIESILNQTFKEFEFIISDNASTDNTEKICREYASKDNRIRYIRQSTNLGPEANMLFVFDQAKSDYFMWAAHDDIRSPDFLELNLEFLKNNFDYIASSSPVKFKGEEPDADKMGDKSLGQECREERFLTCLKTMNGCGRFYSLMRRSVVQESNLIRNKSYIGLDTTIILELALKGKFNRIERGYLALGSNGVSGSGNIYKAYRKNFLSWIMPLSEFSQDTWRLSNTFTLKRKAKVASIIIKANLITFLHQIKTEFKKKLLHI